MSSAFKTCAERNITVNTRRRVGTCGYNIVDDLVGLKDIRNDVRNNQPRVILLAA